MLPEQAHALLDVFQVVPVRLSDLLPGHVWERGVPDLAGGLRRGLPAGGGEAVLDLPGPLGVGLYGGRRAGLGRTVQLRILQPDAHIASNRSYCYDFL